MDKKKLDFNVLDDPDTVSEMFVPDEQEKERIFRESRRKYQINENGSEAAVPDVSEDTVSGVEEYKRPVWHRYAQVAAAALLLTAGIGGTVCILRNKETVPDETVSFSAELPSETKTENIRTEVVSEAVSIEMMDIGENTSLSKFKAEDEVESTVPEPDTTEAAEEENTTEEAPKTEKAPDKRESTTEAAVTTAAPPVVTTAAPPVVTTPAAATQPVGEPPEVDWAVEVDDDILYDVLNGLSYSPDVYGGDPQYSFSARGTVFYINLSEGWIRRDNGSSQQEARLTSRAVKWINEYMAKYGLAEA